MEDVSAGKPRKIVPIIPFYKADGCTVVREWQEEFEDRAGNKATLTKLIYRNNKGKLSEEIVIRVKWHAN